MGACAWAMFQLAARANCGGLVIACGKGDVFPLLSVAGEFAGLILAEWAAMIACV